LNEKRVSNRLPTGYPYFLPINEIPEFLLFHQSMEILLKKIFIIIFIMTYFWNTEKNDKEVRNKLEKNHKNFCKRKKNSLSLKKVFLKNSLNLTLKKFHSKKTNNLILFVDVFYCEVIRKYTKK